MDRKLIVFDIDGTLVKKDQKKISDRTLNAIKKVQELGHVVSLASGRNDNALYPLAQQLEINNGKTPIVGLNGAEIFSVDNEKHVTFLKEHFFSQELSENIIKLAWKHHVDFFGYTNSPKVNYVGRILAAFSIAMSILRSAKLVKVNKDFSNLNYQVKKFLAYGKQNRMQSFIKDLEPYNLSIFKWSQATDPKSNIEINVSGINKAVGVEEMAKLLGIAQKDVIFFGDGDNDVAALKWAGTGVAMGNAHPGVAEHANEQTLSVSKDGIGVWLEKNIIEKEAL